MLLIVASLAFAHWLNTKGWFSEVTRHWPTPVFATSPTVALPPLCRFLFVPIHSTPFTSIFSSNASSYVNLMRKKIVAAFFVILSETRDFHSS